MGLSGRIFIVCSIFLALKASVTLNITTPQGAHLDSQTLDSRQEYLLEIQAKGVTSLANVTLDGLEQWHAQQQASYTTINTVNSATERSCQLVYHIKPKKEGPFVLGPARIVHNGTTLESNTLQGTLIRATTNNHHVTGNQNQEISLEMSVDYPTAYVHQPLTIKACLYIPLAMTIRECSTPVINQSAQQPLQFSLVKQYTHNQAYHCIEWCAHITPQECGTLRLAPAELLCMVQQPLRQGSFMQAALRSFGLGDEQRTIISNKLSISVQPIPQGIEPYDAISAIKSLSEKLSEHQVAAHDAITYQIIVESDQDISAMPHLALRNIDDFKVHASTVYMHQSAKTFDYILQPLKEGTCIIPEQHFRFLNPTTGKIDTFSTHAHEIRVTPAIRPTKTVPSSTEQKSNDAEHLEPVDHDWHYEQPWCLSTPTMIAIMMIIALFFLKGLLHSLSHSMLKVRWIRKNYALKLYERRIGAYDGIDSTQLEIMLKQLVSMYYGAQATTEDCYAFGRLFTEEHEQWHAFVDKLIAARYALCTKATALKLKNEALVWLASMKERL